MADSFDGTEKRTTIGGLLNTLKFVNLTIIVEISCLTARIGINKFNIDQFKFDTFYCVSVSKNSSA